MSDREKMMEEIREIIENGGKLSSDQITRFFEEGIGYEDFVKAGVYHSDIDEAMEEMGCPMPKSKGKI